MTEALKQLKSLQIRMQKLSGIPGLFLHDEELKIMERLIKTEIARRENAGRKKISTKSRGEQLRIAQTRFRTKNIQKGKKELRKANEGQNSTATPISKTLISEQKPNSRKSSQRLKKNPNARKR